MERKEDYFFVVVDLNIYPLRVIYGAMYVFLDKFYFFLEKEEKKKIKIRVKPKKKNTIKNEEAFRDEFLNEMINFYLRDMVSRNNRQIREYIIATSLASGVSALQKSDRLGDGDDEEDFFDKIDQDFIAPWENKKEEDFFTDNDPDDICIPWEEKKSNEKSKKKKKKKS